MKSLVALLLLGTLVASALAKPAKSTKIGHGPGGHPLKSDHRKTGEMLRKLVHKLANEVEESMPPKPKPSLLLKVVQGVATSEAFNAAVGTAVAELPSVDELKATLSEALLTELAASGEEEVILQEVMKAARDFITFSVVFNDGDLAAVQAQLTGEMSELVEAALQVGVDGAPLLEKIVGYVMMSEQDAVDSVLATLEATMLAAAGAEADADLEVVMEILSAHLPADIEEAKKHQLMMEIHLVMPKLVGVALTLSNKDEALAVTFLEGKLQLLIDALLAEEGTGVVVEVPVTEQTREAQGPKPPKPLLPKVIEGVATSEAFQTAVATAIDELPTEEELKATLSEDLLTELETSGKEEVILQEVLKAAKEFMTFSVVFNDGDLAAVQEQLTGKMTELVETALLVGVDGGPLLEKIVGYVLMSQQDDVENVLATLEAAMLAAAEVDADADEQQVVMEILSAHLPADIDETKKRQLMIEIHQVMPKLVAVALTLSEEDVDLAVSFLDGKLQVLVDALLAEEGTGVEVEVPAVRMVGKPSVNGDGPGDKEPKLPPLQQLAAMVGVTNEEVEEALLTQLEIDAAAGPVKQAIQEKLEELLIARGCVAEVREADAPALPWEGALRDLIALHSLLDVTLDDGVDMTTVVSEAVEELMVVLCKVKEMEEVAVAADIAERLMRLFQRRVTHMS